MKKPQVSKLRRADLMDASVLAHLINMISEGAFATRLGIDADINETWLDVARKTISQPDSEISYSNCIVYEINGDIAGMVMLNWLSSDMPVLNLAQITEEERPANELIVQAPGSLLIRELGVFEKYRKQGVAKAFLQLAEGYARSKSIPVLSLTVHETSGAALALYEKSGFKLIDSRQISRHSTWATGSRLYLMCKQLPQ